MNPAELFTALEVAIKRLLVDSQSLSPDGAFYQKTITREKAEEAKISGALSFSFDAQGNLIIEMHGAQF